jgi:hypothetical protein
MFSALTLPDEEKFQFVTRRNVLAENHISILGFSERPLHHQF